MGCIKIKHILVLVLALGGHTSVMAVDWAVGASTGTLGFGVVGTVKMTGNLNTRFGINSGDFEIVDVEDDEGLNYDDPTYDFDNIYGFVDWHPSQGGSFRTTVGLVLNDNSISAAAFVDSSGQSIGNSSAPIGTSVSGEVTFDDVAAYAGIGWGNAFGRGGAFNFGFDMGILFQGSPQVNLVVVDPSNTISDADVQLERQDLENEVEDVDVWPVLNFNFGYRF